MCRLGMANESARIDQMFRAKQIANYPLLNLAIN